MVSGDPRRGVGLRLEIGRPDTNSCFSAPLWVILFRVRWGLLFSIISFGVVAAANPSGPGLPNPHLGTGASGDRVSALYQQLRSILPAGSKAECVLKKANEVMGFDKTAGTSVGSFNSGAETANQQRLNKMPCYATLTKAFYDELNEGGNAKGRPTLGEVAQGADSGRVWKLAQKYSGGDNRLAMLMIGTCLHDDQSNRLASPAIRSDSPLVQKNDPILRKFADQVRSLRERLKSDGLSTDEKTALQGALDKAEEELDFYSNKSLIRKKVFCPDVNSNVFQQGGLSPTTVLDPKVRDLLAYAHGRKMSQIPAKEYHVYGAAALGCALSECKVSEAETRLIQQAISRAYRGIRLCSLLSNPAPKARGQAWDDAAVIFRENFLSANMVREGGVCTFALYDGPLNPESDEPRGIISRLMHDNACKKSGWSQQRCDDALRVVRSWFADEAWTAAQHDKGGAFGNRACASEPPLQNPEQKACAVLKRLEDEVGTPAVIPNPGGTGKDGTR